jgi:serine/threonine protein kinase
MQLASTDIDAPVHAKVADFGLSKMVGTEISGALRTWQWLAPEVLARVPRYDERSDIYSFGMCCWEIATRCYPYDEFQNDLRFVPAARQDESGNILSGFSANQLVLRTAVLEEDLRPSLPNADEQCPEAFSNLIVRCWNKDPNQRPSFATIVAQLCDMLGIVDDDRSATDSGSTQIRAMYSPRATATPEYRALQAPEKSLFQSLVSFRAKTVLENEIWQMALVGADVWLGCADGVIRVINATVWIEIRTC